MWANIALLVDLISCGAILYPVIWYASRFLQHLFLSHQRSIRHLSQTLGTDGKAAASLARLKFSYSPFLSLILIDFRLFRRFYVLVLAYIYLTRILVYLVSNSVPFRYTWTAPFLDELITLGFYLITALVF